MFIHHILWFKSLIHLKEACAHGSRWARKEETPLSKTAEKQPNCFVLLSLWGFYTQKHGGRGFQRGETKLHLRGIERSQIQPFCWYTLGSQAQALHTMQHPQPSCVDQLGPPFVGYFLYSPHPSRHKGPLQVALSLCESYQLQTANGVLQCWEVVDSICLVPFFKFFFFWCQKSRASRIAIQTPCGFTNICCWQGTYPKLWENMKQEVACCEQFTAVGYNIDSQENGFILRNEDFVFSFKVHRCLWGAFTVKCYRCLPSANGEFLETICVTFLLKSVCRLSWLRLVLTCNRAECTAVEGAVCSLCCVSCCGNGGELHLYTWLPLSEGEMKGSPRGKHKDRRIGKRLRGA